MQKSFFILLLIGFFSNVLPGKAPEERAGAGNVCNLPAPAYVNVLEVSNTWASIQWAAVSGAAAYNVKTFDAASGQLVDELWSFNTGPATVDNLLPGRSYNVQVRAICPNQQFGAPVATSVNTLIIELVVLGRPPGTCEELPENGDVCTPQGIGQQQSCEYDWVVNGTPIWINVYKTLEPSVRGLIRVELPGTDNVRLERIVGEGLLDFSLNLLSNNDGMEVCIPGVSNCDYMLYRFRFGQIPDGGVSEDLRITGVRIDPDYSFNTYLCNDNESKLEVRRTPVLASVSNPFNERLDIQLSAPLENEATYQIFDLRGSLHSAGKLPAGYPAIGIPVSQLPNRGVYLLRVTTADGRAEVRKIFKLTESGIR